MIIGDVAVLPERMKRELIRGEHARAEFAIRAQTALKEAMDEMGPYRHIEGIGVKRATIHPELGARIRVKYGIKALHDPDFIKALLRDNPFLRVQTIPAKLTIRVDGLRDEGLGKRRTPNAERPISNGEEVNSRHLEPRQNKGSAGQQSVQPRFDEDRGPGGDPATPFAVLEIRPVIKQTAGVSLVLSPAGGAA